MFSIHGDFFQLNYLQSYEHISSKIALDLHTDINSVHNLKNNEARNIFQVERIFQI